MDVRAAIIACLIYFGGPLLLAAIVLPWFINCFNGFGYWHNALTLFGEATGLEKRIERHRRAKYEAERMKWEAKRRWEED
jgi:hypothetical protein